MQSKGENELAFNDLVDGKQRLNTLKEFISGEFKDMQGNYYDDLAKILKNAMKYTCCGDLIEYDGDSDLCPTCKEHC